MRAPNSAVQPQQADALLGSDYTLRIGRCERCCKPVLCNTTPAARTVLKAHSVYLHCCSAEERPRLVHVVPARKQHCEIVHAEPVLLHSRRSCSVRHPVHSQRHGVRCMLENSACVAFNATFSGSALLLLWNGCAETHGRVSLRL
jgi:hypothetical protein